MGPQLRPDCILVQIRQMFEGKESAWVRMGAHLDYGKASLCLPGGGAGVWADPLSVVHLFFHFFPCVAEQ